MTTKQKLLKLADFLEHKVKSRWFNLGSWSTPGFPEKKCGTTACAGGWATVCFPKSGLSLVSDEFNDEALEISYKGVLNMDAVEVFFGINEDTAEYLFAPDRYPSRRRGKKSVIRRLREVANNGGRVDEAKLL